MDGILPMLFWAGVFGLIALVGYGLIRLQKRFWPTERDLAERHEQARHTTASHPRGSGTGQGAPRLHTVQETPLQRSPLPLREWLELVNRRPDQVPHLFIEGGSGAGKTTLATAILQDRGGPVTIIGVKPDDGWSQDGNGYIYRSDKRPAALAALLAEVRRRLDENDRSGLTIVLDDFTRLASSHREAVELYKEVADVGRSLRVRLILIARGRQVKGIGASGESDLLDHFVFLTVSRDQHRVTLEMDEESTPLDTAQVGRLAQPINPARFWQPAPEMEKLLTGLLNDYQDADRPAQGELVLEQQFPASQSGVTGPEPEFTPEEIARIAAQIARGKRERGEIIKGMPRYSGRKYKAYAAFYDRLYHAIEETSEQVA